MEFLKNGKRRSLLSESLYIILNLLLVAAIFAAVQVGDTPWLAFGLVTSQQVARVCSPTTILGC